MKVFLYILLEPFKISSEFINVFTNSLENRESFIFNLFIKKEDEAYGNFSSIIKFQNNKNFSFLKEMNLLTLKIYKYSLNLISLFRLLIIGGEHDAVKLCKQAVQLGWEVDVVTSIKDPKQLSDFPGAKSVIAQTPEVIDFEKHESRYSCGYYES